MNNIYQKALDNLVFCKMELKCFKCNHKERCTMKRDNDILQELVEKETPKKPYYEADGYANGIPVYDMAYCPNCNNLFEEYENNGWGENYCHNCGQRLDWSVDENED